MLVTKEFTFDAAHRLPNHKGKCKNIHGHLFKLQISLRDRVKNIEVDKGKSYEGMIIDFEDVKKIVKEFIDANLDHHYLSYSGDTVINNFMKEQGMAITIVDFIPTVENMVEWIRKELSQPFYAVGVSINRVRLWETPTSHAEYSYDITG